MTDIRVTQVLSQVAEQSDATKLRVTQVVAQAGLRSSLTKIRVTQVVVQVAFPFQCSFVPVVPTPELTCPIAATFKNDEYTSIVVASGGTPPYTLALIDGTLPIGLTFHPDTGVIDGIPTVQGTFFVTFQVTDSNGVIVQHDCSIVVGDVQWRLLRFDSKLRREERA